MSWKKNISKKTITEKSFSVTGSTAAISELDQDKTYKLTSLRTPVEMP